MLEDLGMIVQNSTGNKWLGVCSFFSRKVIVGFALPCAVILRSDIPQQSPTGWRILAHEQEHQEQMRRYRYIGFAVLYTYQFIRYGYQNMPLEKEARKAEDAR